MPHPFPTRKLIKFIAAAMLAIPMQIFPATEGIIASDEDAQHFGEFFKTSITRGVSYNQDGNPVQSARQDIYVDSILAAKTSELPEFVEILIERFHDNLLLDRWLNTNVKVFEPTDEQVREYMDAHIQDFMLPDMVKFQHIFLFAEPEAKAERKKLAEQIVKRLNRGMDFEKLAREYSDAKKQGETNIEIGPVEVSRLQDVLADELKTMEYNEIRGPIETKFGWEILRQVEYRKENVPSLDDVGPIVKQRMMENHATEIRDAILAELGERYPGVTYEDRLEGKENVPESLVVAKVHEREYTVGDVYESIEARALEADEEAPAALILRDLPQFITTQQVKLDAEATGLLTSPDLVRQFDYIRNRLTAEQYYKTYKFEGEIPEAEIQAYYEKNVQNFRELPKGRGIIYVWEIPNADKLTKSETNFETKVILKKLEDLKQKFEDKELDPESLKELADRVDTKDWFQPGPGGYSLDTTFFATEPGNLSQPFEAPGGIAVAYVEEIEQGDVKPFEEVRAQAERLVRLEKSLEARKAMVQDILESMPDVAPDSEPETE